MRAFLSPVTHNIATSITQLKNTTLIWTKIVSLTLITAAQILSSKLKDSYIPS